MAFVLIVLTMLLTAACNHMEAPSVHSPPPAAIQGGPEESISETAAAVKDSMLTAAKQEDSANRQGNDRSELRTRDVKGTAVETVLRMYEALRSNDTQSYFQHTDIPSVRISPAKLEVLIEEAGKREILPERFVLFDKLALDLESRQLFSITYGSQAEIVLEELSYGDQNLWFVTEFSDGLKVVDQTTIYPGAYELGRDAAIEELIAVEIRNAAEDRQFLASKASKPLLTPEQTVSLLYQAAQEEDGETFFATSGGDEGYFSGHYAGDMVEFTEWMKSFESVQQVSIQGIPQENIAGTYRGEYNERFGSAWQFVVAWDPRDESGYQGTYWILAPSGDGTRYVVKQALTAHLESFFSDTYIHQPQI